MTAENFVYWLQGYLELAGPNASLIPFQIDAIREHIALVLTKATPTHANEDAMRRFVEGIKQCGTGAPSPLQPQTFCAAAPERKPGP